MQELHTAQSLIRKPPKALSPERVSRLWRLSVKLNEEIRDTSVIEEARHTGEEGRRLTMLF